MLEASCAECSAIRSRLPYCGVFDEVNLLEQHGLNCGLVAHLMLYGFQRTFEIAVYSLYSSSGYDWEGSLSSISKIFFFLDNRYSLCLAAVTEVVSEAWDQCR